MSDDSPQRRLRIDLTDLVEAFESGFDETTYYLDLETGRVLAVDEETRDVLDQLGEEGSDDEVAQASLPDWQLEALQIAEAVEAGFGTRYLVVPHVESWEGYQDLLDFIETVTGRHLREKLEVPLTDQVPFAGSRMWWQIIPRNASAGSPSRITGCKSACVTGWSPKVSLWCRARA